MGNSVFFGKTRFSLFLSKITQEIATIIKFSEDQTLNLMVGFPRSYNSSRDLQNITKILNFAR